MKTLTLRISLSVVLLAAAIYLPGCAQRQPANPPPPPGPSFTGEPFLHGTIGSLATLRYASPMLVSGYGIVARLDGTGSPDCPPELRQAMLSEISRRGIGRHEYGFESVSPSEFLASETTAVVRIEGVIRPGAVRGSTFDVLVTALPQTQTTSLAGGVLYTTDLYAGASGTQRFSATPLAIAQGPIFLDPFQQETGDDDDRAALREELRVGRVLGGGRVRTDLPLAIVIHRPSYRMTTEIAHRINSRFQRGPEDPVPLAEARSDTVIALNVLERFKDNPRYMLDLIGHLYLNPTAEFGREKAAELAGLLDDEEYHEFAEAISHALYGFGRPVLDGVIRERYEHPEPVARLAALRAGARLGDNRALEHLSEMAGEGLGEQSRQATELIGELLRGTPTNARARAIRALRQLLDHDDPEVRVAAFDALADADDPLVERRVFGAGLEWAQVRCEKPMIHVTRESRARIIVFNDRLGFTSPLFFSHWDSRFMLRSAGAGPTDSADAGGARRREILAVGQLGNDRGAEAASERSIDLFYQKPGFRNPIRTRIPDNVPYLIGMMAFDPDPDSSSVGLSMSYSQIVSAIHHLVEQGSIDAPLVIESSELTRRIAEERAAQRARRPERGDEPADPDLRGRFPDVPAPEIGDWEDPIYQPPAPHEPENQRQSDSVEIPRP